MSIARCNVTKLDAHKNVGTAKCIEGVSMYGSIISDAKVIYTFCRLSHGRCVTVQAANAITVA